MRRIVPLLALVAFLAACDSPPDAPPASTPTVAATAPRTPSVTYLTPTPTPRVTRTPVAPLEPPPGHPLGTTTGIEELDVVLAALEVGDPPRDLLRFHPEPCVAEGVLDYGPPPVCPEGVPPGSPVELLATVGCHGGYITPRVSDSPFRAGSEVPRLIFGIARPGSPLEPRAEFAVVVTHASRSGAEFGITYEVGEGGIVAINSGCGNSPEQMWERLEPSEVILAPPDEAYYGYPPETHIEGGGIVIRVAQAVVYRQPADLRALLLPAERDCLPDVRISYQPTEDCSRTVETDDPTFLVNGCHLGLRSPEEFEAELYGLLDGRPRLYGVRRITSWPDERARFVVFFVRHDEVAPAFAIFVGDGIVGLDGACFDEAPALWAKYEDLAVGEAILPPWEPR